MVHYELHNIYYAILKTYNFFLISDHEILVLLLAYAELSIAN